MGSKPPLLRGKRVTRTYGSGRGRAARGCWLRARRFGKGDVCAIYAPNALSSHRFFTPSLRAESTRHQYGPTAGEVDNKLKVRREILLTFAIDGKGAGGGHGDGASGDILFGERGRDPLSLLETVGPCPRLR